MEMVMATGMVMVMVIVMEMVNASALVGKTHISDCNLNCEFLFICKCNHINPFHSLVILCTCNM